VLHIQKVKRVVTDSELEKIAYMLVNFIMRIDTPIDRRNKYTSEARKFIQAITKDSEELDSYELYHILRSLKYS